MDRRAGAMAAVGAIGAIAIGWWLWQAASERVETPPEGPRHGGAEPVAAPAPRGGARPEAQGEVRDPPVPGIETGPEPPAPPAPPPRDGTGDGSEPDPEPSGTDPATAPEAVHEPTPSAPGREPDAGDRHGSLSPEAIRGVVRENLGYFRFCFEWELGRHPDLAGRLTMRFVIAEDGSVREASVLEDGLANETVSRCFQGVTSRMTFPPPEGGEVTVHYPFQLAGAPPAERPAGI